MKNIFLFNSERLGFRNWIDSDISKMIEINSDPDVMEFFPAIATPLQTKEFILRMQRMFLDKGFCYYAVEKLEDGEFIGFIGLCEQTYKSKFTPCIDIGWRIKKSEWNKGFATEGAKRCLEFAANDLKVDDVYSIAPRINKKSEHIMKKIGLKKQYEFVHPLLTNDARLKTCILYKTE